MTTKVKYNNKYLWHYYFTINSVKYLHSRMFSKEQAINTKRINNH